MPIIKVVTDTIVDTLEPSKDKQVFTIFVDNRYIGSFNTRKEVRKQLREI